MTSYTNHTAGPKGFNLKGGGTAWIDPGQTVEIDDAEVVGTKPDLGKPHSSDEESAATLAEALALIDTLKARVAELEAAASKPKLPGLTGKSKADLQAIAAAEGVTIEDDATVNDIISAIELHREAA